MRRNPPAASGQLAVTALIERVEAERAGASDAVPVTAPPPPPRRSRGRRIVPVVLGAAATLVVALVATQLRPATAPPPVAPDLDVALAQGEARAPAPVPAATLPDPADPAPADGTQAATGLGWEPVAGDEFDVAVGPMFELLDGPGRGGDYSPDALAVADGVLTISGDAAGRTGGVAWREGRQHGRWEVRARFPAGDEQYRPVLLLWPSEVDWPAGGEIDFAETTSASDDVAFVLHHGPDNDQVIEHRDVDITEWHNYAVEWTPAGVVGYLDGEKWFESTDEATLPPGPMHLVIQLDHVPGDAPPEPSEMQVDWVRLYA